MAKFYCLILILFSTILHSQNKYFPPISGTNWETTTPQSLGWDISKIQPLYDFLENENSKAFIVLKDGRIVLEKYFGSFNKDSVWYWASAGKTLTSFLIGKAQEEGFLKLSDLTSKYLGNGWTKCSKEKEDKITIWNQLTMTSGLDDGVKDNHCTIDSCLIYKADAGARWAYHNAPYTLLEKVITTATGLPINTFTQQKLKNQTGITGSWLMIDYDNVFFSKPRSMARYGLLIQNDCIWNKDTLLHDTSYIRQMTNTSQNINKSYGYLWWLNGKSSYMLPTTQFVFNGSYAPAAPSDMYAALGKNGQILSISKSLGLVVVRMGNLANSGEVPNQLCNSIWEKLNDVINNTNSVTYNELNQIKISPNPASEYIEISKPSEGFDASDGSNIKIINSFGECIMTVGNNDRCSLQRIDISHLPVGLYFIQIGNFTEKFLVVR